MIGTQIYGYFKSSPRRCGFGSGAGKRVKRFDRIDPVPFVGVGITHNSAENWGRIDDLNLRAFPFGGAAAYPAKFASLDKLDELVALAQCCPIFVAEVVS